MTEQCNFVDGDRKRAKIRIGELQETLEKISKLLDEKTERETIDGGWIDHIQNLSYKITTSLHTANGASIQLRNQKDTK